MSMPPRMHDLSSAPEMPAIGLPLVAPSRVRADRCNGAGGGSFARETISLRLAGLALRAATKLQPVAAILLLFCSSFFGLRGQPEQDPIL
jgi:hypothetical protein